MDPRFQVAFCLEHRSSAANAGESDRNAGKSLHSGSLSSEFV